MNGLLNNTVEQLLIFLDVIMVSWLYRRKSTHFQIVQENSSNTYACILYINENRIKC